MQLFSAQELLPPDASLFRDDGRELALADMDAYLERLAALTESPDLRAEMGQALRRRFDERFDLEASGPALLAACRQAADLARARLTTPS